MTEHYTQLKKTIYLILEQVDNFEDKTQENAKRIDIIGYSEYKEEADHIVSSITYKGNRDVWVQEVIKIKPN